MVVGVEVEAVALLQSARLTTTATLNRTKKSESFSYITPKLTLQIKRGVWRTETETRATTTRKASHTHPLTLSPLLVTTPLTTNFFCLIQMQYSDAYDDLAAPLCPGHGMPCALRTTVKEGNNIIRFLS